MNSVVVFGEGDISLGDIVDIAFGRKKVALSEDPDFLQQVSRGVDFLTRLLREEGVIYGVTTGFGDSCTVGMPEELVAELPLHLTRFHGCGMGRIVCPEIALATLATRLASLSRGYSGVRMVVLEQLKNFINNSIIPEIPEEGSVGASGDLTPLSYVAAAMIGERHVHFRGVRCATQEALKAAGINPIQLQPKEGLAIMNGTTLMTAMACMAYSRADYLTRVVTRMAAMASLGLMGNIEHFDKKLFSLKPHPGQMQIADWIRGDLKPVSHPRNLNRLQDRYSIRCAPHVIGVLKDALPWMEKNIECELNSANDNPLIDSDAELILHGGHFYGGHIAFVMDSLKCCVANLADLMDRQIALLVDPKFNNGLPANLSAARNERRAVNHGFKAVQIACSAWAAEALKLTMPASVFSRSTECHNQDKVSMGTIAARDCLRILELTEQIAAAGLLVTCQAIDLRLENGEIVNSDIVSGVDELKASIRLESDLLIEDRPLDGELRKIQVMIQQKSWVLYE